MSAVRGAARAVPKQSTNLKTVSFTNAAPSVHPLGSERDGRFHGPRFRAFVGALRFKRPKPEENFPRYGTERGRGSPDGSRLGRGPYQTSALGARQGATLHLETFHRTCAHEFVDAACCRPTRTRRRPGGAGPGAGAGARVRRRAGQPQHRGEYSVCDSISNWVGNKTKATDISGNEVTVLPDVNINNVIKKQFFFETTCRGNTRSGSPRLPGIDSRHWNSYCTNTHTYVRALTSFKDLVAFRLIRINAACVCVLSRKSWRH
ncbi:hypothetical protein ANANG_G00215860 [Anguilla anguilla]|uniref:Nerve growth factor-related domain-containing protein n=1 Tax=Anguilla anguilla TaxID=7936 RepID=A0A9D3M372_ANGAN|nr:hypothetical protein ANANG_G00215860 [Anguilla anguilla]